MVERKTPIGELLVWLLVRSAMRRMFARVRCHAAENPRAAGVPLLGVANHPSWWDGYTALLCARHYGLSRYLMMEEAQLRRYPFFAWAGCFSVDRSDARDAARSVAYAAHILTTRPRPIVWLFPQADIVPTDRRPIATHPGAAHILRRATRDGRRVGLLPVAWHPIFRGEQHPEILVRIGAVQVYDYDAARDIPASTRRIQAAVTTELDTLQHDICTENLTTYRTILRGQAGVNDLFDRMLRRARLVDEP